MWPLISLIFMSLISTTLGNSPIPINQPINQHLDWYESTNTTTKFFAVLPGTVYNILRLPVYVQPAIAIITIVNTMDVEIIMQWTAIDQSINQSTVIGPMQSVDQSITNVSYANIIPFDLTYTNQSIILSGSITNLTVDCRLVITINQPINQPISYSTAMHRPFYQLQFRDRDQMKLFMVEAEPILPSDWIMSNLSINEPINQSTNQYQIGFNLTFPFTIPIQSFNFHAYCLVRFDTYTSQTSLFYPRQNVVPLLSLVPYWYSITPRWNNQLKQGDALTIAGSLSVGIQSGYGCEFQISSQDGGLRKSLFSAPVSTNNTGMFQCILPSIPNSYRDRVHDGDIIRVVPGYLRGWSIMYPMIQAESQDISFTLSLPAAADPWYSWTSWPIYLIIVGSSLIGWLVSFFLIRHLCHLRRAKSADVEELDDSEDSQSADDHWVETAVGHINIPVNQPTYHSTSQPVTPQFGVPSEPIDMQDRPKILVKPSRFDWITQRRDPRREFLLSS